MVSVVSCNRQRCSSFDGSTSTASPGVRRYVTDHHREIRQVFRLLTDVNPVQFRIRVRLQPGKKKGNFPEFPFQYSGIRGVRT